MICRQFDVLYREGATSGRVMAIAIHPYLTGMSHRIDAFDAALAYICRHDRVWKATGSEIVRHYRMQVGLSERWPFDHLAGALARPHRRWEVPRQAPAEDVDLGPAGAARHSNRRRITPRFNSTSQLGPRRRRFRKHREIHPADRRTT